MRKIRKKKKDANVVYRDYMTESWNTAAALKNPWMLV